MRKIIVGAQVSMDGVMQASLIFKKERGANLRWMKDQRALYIITTTMTPIAKPMTLSFYFFSGRGVRRQRAPTPLQAVWMEAR